MWRLMLLVSLGAVLLNAQPAATAPKFEVASVKSNKTTDSPTANFPLGPGDVYVRNGGYFNATGFPLVVYLSFAYKLMGNQGQYVMPQLPDWAKTERYDIQARAANDPGKDGMRLMMRSLLAERFGLAIHYDEREVPVLALVFMKPGKLGPQLHMHADGSPCPTEPPTPTSQAVVDGMPAFCNGIYPLPTKVPGHLRFGGRNVTLGFIADTLSYGVNLGRPLLDRTGLEGTVDFILEFFQERVGPASAVDAQPDTAGLTFEEALREQLGIKLKSERGPIKVLVIDHVERPSVN